jgi:competence protein ComEC
MSASPLPPLKTRFLPFYAGRPLVCCALCYGAGILLGAARPFHWLWAAGLGVACLFAFFYYLLGRKTALGVFPAFFFLGLVLAALSVHPNRLPEGDYAFTGTVDGGVRYRDEQVACTLKNVTADGESIPSKAYWTFYVREGEAAPALSNGDHVSFSGKLYHPQGQQNPYGFDFDLYLKQKGVHVGLYGQEVLTVDPAQTVWDGNLAFYLRTALAQALYGTMGEKAPLAVVMLLGSSDPLPEESLEDFRVTGTAHVLSISGLHVAYLAGMLIWLLKRFRLGPKPRLVILAVFLGAYSWLVGMSPPVIRSALMCLLFMGAKPLGKPYDPLTIIAASFLLLLIFRPLDLLSPSFQLSFGAVTGMLLIGDPLLRWQNRVFPEKKKKGRRGRLKQYLHKKWQRLKTLPALGISAQLGIALPLAAWYQQLSVLGIFVNLLVIPYTGILMMVYIAALILSPLGIIGLWAGKVAAFLSDVLLQMVHFGAKFPGMSLSVPSPGWPIIIGGTAFLLLLSPYVIWRGRKRALALSISAVFALAGTMALANRDVRYIQFSAGNADAAVLEDGGYTMVIDTGETGSEISAYLRARGRGIDALVLTHLHTDHAGGVEELLNEGISIRKAYIPEGAETALADAEGLRQLNLLRAAGVPVDVLCAGDKLQMPRCSLTVLWPQEGKVRPGQDANDSSLTGFLQMESVSLLQMGDLSGMYEKYAAPKADILKVAHHGSASSTGDDLLKAAAPQMAILSCGGTGGLPSDQTLQRIKENDIPLYRMDESGAVSITIRGDQWEAIPFRKETMP